MATLKTNRTEKQILASLAELGGKLTGDDDILREGTRIIIPETMALTQVADLLYKKHEEMEEPTNFVREFDCRPWDGAYQTWHVVREVMGIVSQKATPGMFGPEPPTMIDIKISVSETVQVPWGRIGLPLLGPKAWLHFGDTYHSEKGMIFQLYVRAAKKHAPAVEGLFKAVADRVASHSIYRGKAFDGKQMPDFLDLSGVDESKVVYSGDALRQLEAQLWTPIRHTEMMRQLESRLKRAVVLEGPYGTGKSEGLRLTAKIATENGWTFIMARPDDDLYQALMTAKMYTPCVVAFEDVDILGSGDNEDRNAISKVLDVFDGVQAKGSDVMAVLTTNHIEKLHKGMLRPGRIDAVIHIGELDLAGIRQLILSRIPVERLQEIDWERVADAYQGFLPAFVSEGADRTLRYAVSRTHSLDFTITTQDLCDAADGLRPQLNLMNGAGEGSTVPTLDQAFRARIESVLTTTAVKDEGTGINARFLLDQPVEN